MAADHRFPPALLNSYHALAVLVGIAFLAATISPGRVGSLGGYAAFLGPPLFLATLALLSGILGVHVGGAEQAWWEGRSLPPGRTLRRLVALVALGLGLFSPFLVAFRALGGGSWGGMLGVVGLLLAVGLAWAGVGFLASSALKSGGIRFVCEYGFLLAAYFVPLVVALPISPITAATALWKGELSHGLLGLLIWWGLAGVALGGVWVWKRTRF